MPNMSIVVSLPDDQESVRQLAKEISKVMLVRVMTVENEKRTKTGK